MQTWPWHSTNEWYPTHPSSCTRDSQRVAPRASKSLVNEHDHAWPRDGINQRGLGRFGTLCAVLWTAAELWTLTKGQTVRTQILPAWPFLIYFPPNRGWSTHRQGGHGLQWKSTDATLGGHEVSVLVMTYTQVGRAGASGYSLFIQKTSSPGTVMPTAPSARMHSQRTSAQMPLPPDWPQRGKRTSHPHAACETLNRAKFRIHSYLGVPDNTCWPSEHANQRQTWGQSSWTPLGCPKRPRRPIWLN